MSVEDRGITESMSPSGPKDLTRREVLRRGAAVSGLVWVPPVISSIQLTPGTATDTSPPPSTTTSTSTSTSTTTTLPPTTTTTAPGPDISFIGLQVTCGSGLAAMGYTLKYEGCDNGDCFESDPGKFPKCDGFMVSGSPADGDDLGFLVDGPDASGCVTIHVPAGCTVTASVIKGGLCCVDGPAGLGSLVFCKPIC